MISANGLRRYAFLPFCRVLSVAGLAEWKTYWPYCDPIPGSSLFPRLTHAHSKKCFGTTALVAFLPAPRSEPVGTA